MAHTLFGYFESRAGTTVLSEVAGLADQSVNVRNDNIVVPSDCNQLIGAFASMSNATDTLVAARLSAPSMRTNLLLDLPVLNVPAAGGNNEPANPAPINVLLGRPVQLVSGEFLQALEQSDGTTAANLCLVLAWLGNGSYANPYKGYNVMTVRATAAQTLVANAWTAGVITLDQQLAAGTYAVIGMRASSAGLVAARIIFSNSGNRPGCLACDSLQDVGHPIFRSGNMGVWGTFVHTNTPQIEFLSVSADTAETVFFDLVKIA